MVAKYKKLFFAFSTLAISFSAVFLLVQPVSADYNPTNGKCNGTDALYEVQENGRAVQKCKSATTNQTSDGTTTGATNDASTDKDDVTCAVEKVGWIICPILESMAKISDNMFDVLANNFLQTDTSLFKDDSGTKVAWEVARNLANVMFIIAFLVIIISQVTNMGISNYGIKKMLPRLVIAAIAVNVSYYICQLAVDLTNIFGYEIQNALVQIANGIGPSVFGSASNLSGFATGGGTGTSGSDVGVLTVIAIAALASTAVWLILGPGLAVISVVIITILAIIIILLLRKALIVLLIVISPIAFVLYLLPNTEKFYSKWMKMFGQLLMVFPVVGLLFGAGQLASTIILVSGATTPPANAQTCDPDTPAATNTSGGSSSGSASYDGKCDGYIGISGTRANPADASKTLPEGKGASWTLGLVAVGVAVAPLMAVYAVLKGALSAAGAIGGTISTMTKKGQGASSRLAKGSDERRQKRFGIQALGNGRRANAINAVTGGQYRRRAKRSAVENGLDGELKRAQQKYIADEIGDGGGFANKVAGGGLLTKASESGTQRAIAGAQLTIQRATAEAIEAENILLRGAGQDQLRSLGAGGPGISDAQQIAAAQMVVNNADYQGINQLVDKISSSTASNAKELRIALSEALQKSSSRPAYLSQGALAELRTGSGAMSSEDLIRSSVANNTYAPEVMSRASKDELSIVGDYAVNNGSGLTIDQRQTFINNASGTLSDPQLARQLGKNKAVIEAIRGVDGGTIRSIKNG